MSGKKENNQLIQEKLEKQVDKIVLIESFINRLKVNGLLDDEISTLLPIVDFIISSEFDERVSQNEINAAINEYNNLLNLFIDRHNPSINEDTQEIPVIKI